MLYRSYQLGIAFFSTLILCILLNILPDVESALPSPPSNSRGVEQVTKSEAESHKNLGFASYQAGKMSDAIHHWEQAIKIYRSAQNEKSERVMAEVIVAQAQAYNSLGQFRQAIPLLENAVDVARRTKDQKTEAKAQGVLGNSYLVSGDYDQAIQVYQASLKLATTIHDSNFITTALNNLVNAYNSRSSRYRTQLQTAQWEGNKQEVARLSDLANQDKSESFAAATRAVQEGSMSGGIPQVRALINIVRMLQAAPESPASTIRDNQMQAIALLEKLADSRNKAYALINLSETLPQESKVKNLEWAAFVSEKIGDKRTQSFALGALGHAYEQMGQLSKAMDFTRQAQFAAQQVNAGDSLYRWQWQAGRIYKATGSLEAGILSYKQAVTTLQGIRSDVVLADRDLQFDIRDQVEPVYRELIALLLDGNQDNSGRIEEALQFVDLLKLTELQSFFGDECLEVRQAISQPQEPIAGTEVVINSIILDEKTYMILRSPGSSVKSYPVALSNEQLASKVKQLRFLLEDTGIEDYFVEVQELYDLLIRPMAADISAARPSKLVFINDGILRNIPMAALHDGKQFLVEKYPIAMSVGFNSSTNKRTEQKRGASIFGLSVEIPPFAALPNVAVEAEAVQELTGGNKFLNKEFTRTNLEQQIQQNYSIVHLATHGQFGGTPESSFLQAFDNRIFLKDFEKTLQLRKEPLELLTLSACQTAAGDDRAALGLAGLALRTGAKNVLASLWFINDAKTVPLITDFYSQLQKHNITEAEALRDAQVKLIFSRTHPGIWSSFILSTE